jgi:hypothetical protein
MEKQAFVIFEVAYNQMNEMVSYRSHTHFVPERPIIIIIFLIVTTTTTV